MEVVRDIKQIFLSLVLPLLVGLVVGFVTLQAGIYVFFLYVGIGFVALSILRPLEALFLYVLIYPLLSSFSISLGRGIPDISFNRAGVLVILVAVLLRAYFANTKLKARNFAEFLMLLFCILATLSMSMNYDNPQLIGNLLNFMDCFIIPFLVYFLAKNLFSDEEHFIQFTKILIIPALYLATMGIYEFITLNDLFPVAHSSGFAGHSQGLRIEEGIARANGPFSFPEAFGAVLAMIFLILSYHLGPSTHNSNRGFVTKWIYIFVLPVVGFGLYCSMVRNIWLGTVVGSAVRFGIFKRRRLKVAIIFLLLGITVWFGLERIKSTHIYRQRISNVGTFYARVATYKSAFAVFLDHPIIGVGFGNFNYIHTKLNYGSTFRGVMSLRHAHNSYLRILTENGILGFIAYLFIMASFLSYGISLYRTGENRANKEVAATCLGVLITLMVSSFFDTYALWPNVNNFLYLVMGVLASRVSRTGGQNQILLRR